MQKSGPSQPSGPFQTVQGPPTPQESQVVTIKMFEEKKHRNFHEYAHIEVVVTLVVVNFFVFLVIARYPTVRFLRKSVEKLRTGLPDLPKPPRTNILLRKP